MQLKFGEIYKRRELHDHFGGNRQSGISASAKFPVIFLINSSGGDENGYEDGWMEDKKNYLYSGEGRYGDQKLTRGNLQICQHVQRGKRIYLFEETTDTYIKLIGEFYFIDYKESQGLDFNNQNRLIYQFILGLKQQKEVLLTSLKEPAAVEARYKKPNTTERKGLVTSRVGQGSYRRELLNKFQNKCAVTGAELKEILIASHIVPWKDSSDEERRDVNNGILLSPTYDALFDKHLISFDDLGSIIISSKIKNLVNVLGIDPNAKVKVDDEMKNYLSRHREQFREILEN